MDRLVAETETKEKEVQVQTEVAAAQEQEPAQKETNSYINSFKDMTVADIKREEERKEQEEFKKQKEVLLKQQYEEKIEEQTEQQEQKQEQASQKIIEKPNYDLIEENPKVLRLKKRTKEKKALSKKTAGIILSCTLGAAVIISVANFVVIDQMQSSFSQIESSYNLKLSDYLQRLTELDGTKMGTEIIETYPDENKPAGDLGKKSNWFDRLCNFIGRLFGG